MNSLVKFVALLAFATAVPAAAQDVELSSDTLLVRVVEQADGSELRSLEKLEKVVPGDRVVFQHSYRNGGSEPATDFVINNPLPGAVIYRGSDDANARVSVDGGTTYGRLDALTVMGEDGKPRAATQDDVTHVRWIFPQPIPAGASGNVSFEGEVR